MPRLRSKAARLRVELPISSCRWQQRTAGGSCWWWGSLAAAALNLPLNQHVFQKPTGWGEGERPGSREEAPTGHGC